MPETIKIIYLRVSKQDLDNGKTEQQVLEDQLPPILKKFCLDENKCLILKEKGSAYKIDRLKERTEFLSMLQVCFNADKTTINDLFLGNYTRKEIELYVFDSNRLMRNIEFGMLFSILRSLFNIKLFSVNQNDLNILETDLIGSRMAKYLMGTVDSYLAEGYSQNISDHTKKSVKEEKGVTISRDGNKWGRRIEGIEPDQQLELIWDVQSMIKETKITKFKYIYSLINKTIKEKYNIRLSETFIRKQIQYVRQTNATTRTDNGSSKIS